MTTEAITLPVQVTFTAEIIESGFTDGNNPGMLCQLHQLISVRIMAALLVWMQADGYRHLLMRLGKREHTGIVFQVDRDTEKVADTLISRCVQHSFYASAKGLQVKRVQMTV